MGSFSALHLIILLCIVFMTLVVPVGIVVIVIILARRSQGPRANLVACPDCNRPLSPLARTCPHCGRPLSPTN